MTTTEKTYVATFVAYLSGVYKTPQGLKVFADTCRELGVTSRDVQACISTEPAFKSTMYNTLRLMSLDDKKQARQYMVSAALADGSYVSAMILNEIFEECNMFDAVI